jgi:fatty acid desaturase
MDENAKSTSIDSLLDKTTEFVKSSIELAKLKAIDKTAEIVSSLIPKTIVFVMIATFVIFLNLGIALWLGDILNNSFYGFFVVAGFYALVAVIIHFFFHKTIKRNIANNIVKQLLK